MPQPGNKGYGKRVIVNACAQCTKTMALRYPKSLNLKWPKSVLSRRGRREEVCELRKSPALA